MTILVPGPRVSVFSWEEHFPWNVSALLEEAVSGHGTRRCLSRHRGPQLGTGCLTTAQATDQPHCQSAFHPLLCDARAPHPTVIPFQQLFSSTAVVMNSTPPGPWAPYPYGIIPPHCNMALQVSPEPPFPDEELGFCKASYLPRAMWPWTHGWLRPCYLPQHMCL